MVLVGFHFPCAAALPAINPSDNIANIVASNMFLAFMPDSMPNFFLKN
jgi:hypothetical protein